jgi:mono/diheme cytochrome c family protein
VRRLLALALVLAAACNREIAGGEADGPRVYHEACARCHGDRGVPEPGLAAQLGVKDLTDPALHQRLSDDDLRRQIRDGSDDKRMPAFGGQLTEEQVEALVTHIRALRR